jgi:23S rRNA (cytosine1962-C5)-methyltransferase
MQVFPKVILNKGKERSLKNFHPWVFSGAVQSVADGVNEGDIVEVFSVDGNYLATGHYHDGSIKVRLFSFERTPADAAFWLQKLKTAYDLRNDLGLTGNKETNTYRLVHAEGDSLPGLIIDIYGDAAVIQTHTLGMHRVHIHLAEALKTIYGEKLKVIFDKSSEALSKQHISGVSNEYLLGNASTGMALENGLKMFVNWEEGQKTGFFIDQRENRQLLRQFCKGKTVLNTFAYSGGV